MSTSTPTQAELQALLAQWRDWLATHTDTLLALEDQARTVGSPDDIADVAAAFVARKAIAARLDAIDAAVGPDRARAAALADTPVVDDLGGPVGSSLRDAADLLEAVLGKVSRSIAAREAAATSAVEQRRAADADLAVCRRLSAELGLQAGHVASLGTRLASDADSTAVAAELATTRASLEAAARERASTLAKWQGLPARLDQLAGQEAAVRELAAQCRSKIADAPPLAVPSVAAVVAVVHAEGGDDLATLPWPAVRARTAPVLHQIDRVAAALAEAERRFRAPLQRREELRGLLQSFADKATRRGAAATPAVEAAYAEAKAVMWAAPCDLRNGQRLVDAYVALVNQHVGAAS